MCRTRRATVGYRLSELLQLQTELTWIRKGAEGSLQGFEEPLAVDLRMDYVQLPLLVRLTSPTPGPVRPVLFAGPAVSLEVDCEVQTGSGELALTLGCDDSDSERRTFDWSMVFGGGVEYDTGRLVLALDSRYDVGLVSLDDAAEPLDVKNRGFVVTAGISITP